MANLMTRSITASLILIVLGVATVPGIGWSQIAYPDTLAPARSEPHTAKPHFLLAATEVVAVNVFVWSFNRFIREGGTNPGFRVTPETWWENVKNGVEWDDNNFATNQFSHPYHGSLYYNAARSNGFNYWESIPFAFVGSFMWEYMGEVHHPSINDVFSTAVGGIAMGESLHRLATVIRDNTAEGSGRGWRELGALPLDPVGGFTRIVTGDAFRVHANPSYRTPDAFKMTYDAGLRTIADDRLWTNDTTRVFMNFDFRYGDPIEGDIEQPFDYFDMGVQLNFSDAKVLGGFRTRGILFSTDLQDTETSKHRLGVFHHFDYTNNSSFEFGGQELGAAFLSRFQAPASELRTELHLNAILLGATKSDYPSITGRSYDYGPGYAFKFKATLARNNWDYFSVAHEQYWITILNGNKANHLVTTTSAKISLPLVSYFGVGAEYLLYLAERHYDELPDVNQRTPQLRFMLTWQMD